MELPEAMQTTFTGDGPTTHVVIPREMAEADLGAADFTQEQFVAWIDANNDRIYESARRKRVAPDGYEEVILQPGDLLSVMPSVTEPDTDIDWSAGAEIIRVGSNIGVDPVEYTGTLKQAVIYAMEIEADQRSEFCIRTLSRIYDHPDVEHLGELMQSDVR